MKDYIWHFHIINDWAYMKYGQIPMFHIEVLSVHWESHQRWFTILGFSFVWEKLKLKKSRKRK